VDSTASQQYHTIILSQKFESKSILFGKQKTIWLDFDLVRSNSRSKLKIRRMFIRLRRALRIPWRTGTPNTPPTHPIHKIRSSVKPWEPPQQDHLMCAYSSHIPSCWFSSLRYLHSWFANTLTDISRVIPRTSSHCRWLNELRIEVFGL
jgi:hypothetical protein